MRILKRWFPPVAALFLCGCFQVQDELTIQPNGSGQVRLTVRTSVPEEMMTSIGASARFGGGGGVVYPPVTEAEARRFFPPKDFTVKVDEKTAEGGKTITIEAAFKDMKTLLASAYGRSHQLLLKTNADRTLKIQALSGASVLAQAAQFKNEGDMNFLEMPGMEDLQKKKGEMRFEFRISLPSAVTEANGARDGKQVAWIAERAACKDDEEFAAKLTGVFEAACASEGLAFSPAGPPRLGLAPFNQLTAGKIAAAGPLPDTNKIAGAVRFVPGRLAVTRALDLSGEGSGQGSQAQLIGAVVVPAQFAPDQWGQARLEEAVDAKGNNLMPKEDADSMMTMMSRYSRSFDIGGDMEEEDADGAGAKDSGPKPHFVSMQFKAPEWKVKQISKIRGVVELQYRGGSEVIKLSNAVPASLIQDMSKGFGGGFSGFDSERGQVTDSRLTELGLGVQVQMALVQSGTTAISLQTSGKGLLLDAQVFDTEGKPWPTTLMQHDSSGEGQERSCQLLVAGKPKPPFSLALEVGGIGATVDVPIVVENVPVGEK